MWSLATSAISPSASRSRSGSPTRFNAELADSVNHLLVVGFYLINVGYIALALKTQQPLRTVREVIELESTKLGVVLLILGAMHFFNILVLSRMRKNSAHAVHA
jgi:hypothetical protein